MPNLNIDSRLGASERILSARKENDGNLNSQAFDDHADFVACAGPLCAEELEQGKVCVEMPATSIAVHPAPPDPKNRSILRVDLPTPKCDQVYEHNISFKI